ncbi:MAG: OmpH family outer membrane protein [Gammaproteobacteria bacterium]|nr:OmpH family outer membrane protein [Gammaproteobacteria bacterium]
MKFRLMAVVAAVGMGLASFGFANDGLHIAVVNYMNVFQQVPQGNAKLQELKSALQPKVDQLKSQQKALADAADALERNAPTMSKSDRDSQEQALSKQQQDFQTQVANLRSQEDSMEKAAADKFETDLKNAIAAVAQKDGYDMIFTDQATPYVSAQYDVTPEVVANMKKMNG